MTDPREIAERWACGPCFDEKTRMEAQCILGDEQRLLECFGQELAFGTGGLRGILGVGIGRMNRYTVARATQGLADFLGQNGGAVAIGYDTRHGSREFAEVTTGVLAHNGLTAYLFDRPLPTPLLSFAVRELGCAAGVMITASHNPAEYNGYKVYGPDGCQSTDATTHAILKHMEDVEYEAVGCLSMEEAYHKGLLRSVPQALYHSYLTHTLNSRLFPVAEADATGLKVVYTALCGTGIEPVSDVLNKMPGITIVPVKEQCVHNGNFPTCPRPNPELPEALTLALEMAKREEADILLATDPDCDRVGVAVRTQTGEYQLLTGNEVGILLLQYIMQARTQSHSLPRNPLVIKTIVSSDLSALIAQAYGAEVVEVLTGFKYIGEEIGRLEAKGEERRYVFGFEESCGYLAATHVRDKDGVMACLLVTEMAQKAKAQGITMDRLLEKLYSTYGVMESRLENYNITGAFPMDVMSRIMKRLREHPPVQLAGEHITVIKDYLLGIDGLPISDVLSYSTSSGSKAIVRPSGTEPKIKVYISAKGQTHDLAVSLVEQIAKQVVGWISLE